MALITWDPALDTGFDEIDAQHRELVRIINELAEADRHGAPALDIDRALERLLNYADSHFRAEERLMAQAAFPFQDEHHHQHGAFAVKLMRLVRQGNGDAALRPALLEFLKNWLLNHIQVSDQRYASHLRGQPC